MLSVRHPILCSNTRQRHKTDFNQNKISRDIVMTSCFTLHVQSGPKKRGDRLMTIILSNLNRFAKLFYWRFLGKFVVKCILNIPSYLAYVATLPCETLMSAQRAINDKLQGSVATYLTCGGVVNNQIKKGLLLCLWVNFLNRWIFGKITSKSVIISCTLCAWPTQWWKTEKVHETITFLLVTLLNIHRL